MADEGIPENLRSTSLLRQAPQDDVVNPETSAPVIQNTVRVVLAPAHQLPAHLIQLLEEWHKDHPNDLPPAGFKKKTSNEDENRIFLFRTRDQKECPAFEEVVITKPMHYFVYYLPIDDGKQTGALVRLLTWGNTKCYMKKWLGGSIFQAQPIAVRLTQIQGSFDFPDDVQWHKVTERKLPIELKSEEDEQSTRPPVPRKRSREGSDSTSSSGGDIYPEVIRPPARQQQQRARSVHARPSIGDLRDVGNDEGSEDEEETPPAGLSNGGLPIITRSATTSRFTTARSHNSRNSTSRASLPHPLHGGTALLTSPLMVNAPSTTTSDSGVDLATTTTATTMTSNPHLNHSSSPAIITFKLRIPRIRMERHIRIEDNEHSADELFKEATQYFRRHDRLVGTPVLECVIEGEPDCRCIYNAKELRYFIEELRERRGIVKVTVTQSF